MAGAIRISPPKGGSYDRGAGLHAVVRFPDWLVSPLPYALLGIVVLALAWPHVPRALCWTGVVLVICLVAAMTPLVANALIGVLEARVPPVSACKLPLPTTTIVLLGGGTDGASGSPPDYESLSLRSLRRLFAAVNLWQQTPGAHLVISGGSRTGVPESIRLAGLVEAMGVPRSAVTLETRSLTTWENARYVSELQPPLPRDIWLVTSLADQPRALGAFRAWGFTPCPWPADPQYRTPRWRIDEFIPQDSALLKADHAIHEYLGSVEYAWLAWRLQRDRTNRKSANDSSDQTP